MLSGHLACLASGWPALAGLGVGACEQASCLGSNMAWGQSGPLAARAGLAAGSQGGQSRERHGARWTGHLHPSQGPAALGLPRHTQAHACRRCWQTPSLLPPRSQSGMWGRRRQGNPPTALCGETAWGDVIPLSFLPSLTQKRIRVGLMEYRGVPVCENTHPRVWRERVQRAKRERTLLP